MYVAISYCELKSCAKVNLKMSGIHPKGLVSPNPLNAVRLNIPNSPNISVLFCTHPDGEYIVEEISGYKLIIKKPDSKKIKANLEGCRNQKDFTIWVFEPNGNHWMPTHLETLRAFHNLNRPNKQSLFCAIKDVVLNFIEPVESWRTHHCQNIIVEGYPSLLILSYLKWMAVLEDTHYPPNTYLGRKMAFAGYVLINSGLYTPDEIKRLPGIWQ